MTRKRTVRGWIARFTAICVLVASFSVAMAPAKAASNRLENGRRLYAGQCIRDAAVPSREARFCVGYYSNINLAYRGKVCWSWQASGGPRRPRAFVRVGANGDVEFYPFSGGRRLGHSGTVHFRGADLVVGSSRVTLNAKLSVDTGTAYFTFRSCR
jgi:hypothetical protein